MASHKTTRFNFSLDFAPAFVPYISPKAMALHNKKRLLLSWAVSIWIPAQSVYTVCTPTMWEDTNGSLTS